MKTIYIDVYFLINFTVDILALYFASLFSKIKTTVLRTVISAVIGGMYAVIGVLFLENKKIMPIFSLISLVLMVLICADKVSFVRKFKYGMAFLLFQIIIGGFVYYGYCMLDVLFKKWKIESIDGHNKKILVLALLVLLAIGVLKIIILVFGDVRSEKNVRISLTYKGENQVFDALVDSGNLASDPLDKTPVMLVNKDLARRIFKSDLESILNSDFSEYDLKKRIRLIPVRRGGNFEMLFGIKNCDVYFLDGKKREKLSLVIAIDKEGDSYGGYSALIPLSALYDIV